MRRVAISSLVLALLPALLFAQGATVRGRVTDASGTPLARAQISADVVGAALRVASDEQGRYELRGVPSGSQLIHIRLLGYVPQSVRVTVPNGGAIEQNFTLAVQAIALSPVDVTVGSRARHTAAEELAVPVDVFPAEILQIQGTNETSQILQAVSPSVNFPHQSVTDATDIVRPFTLRGLSPDHTLVLINGWRRHQTAVVNTFAYGTGAGSSGVDMNAVPASAIDRIEVLRDGASAQYGSDAIAGVVNVVLKEGQFTPFVNATGGEYTSGNYSTDGRTVDVNGGWGAKVGRGSLGLFAEYLDRQPTNRAWADPFDDGGTGQFDSVNAQGQVVIKRSPVPQPNYHWGDGLERDIMSMANLRLPLNDQGTTEFYSFGGYSFRRGTGNGYRRYATDARNWPEIYPLGFLPEFNPDVTDYSATGGIRTATRGWTVDFGASLGHNDFVYNLKNTLNASLGPCLAPAAPCAPGPDGILGNSDDPGIPDQTSFMAGKLKREEMLAGVSAAKPVAVGLPAPLNVALGVQFRRETYKITPGERASWIDGGHLDQDSASGGTKAVAGSQVFPGFSPRDARDANRTNFGAYVDLETNLSSQFLTDVAGRFEHYSDFGSLATGKIALRFQPSPRVTLRAAASNGFRAPGLGQINFGKVVTNVIAGSPIQVGVFPVSDTASRLLGSKPLKQEKSINLSGGIVISPTERFTLTADVFQVKINDRILLGATFDSDTTRAILARGGVTGVDAVQYFTNGLDTRTRGVDVTADLRVPAGAGLVQFTAAANYTKNEITRVDPLPAVFARDPDETGLIDTVTYIGITEERPDWRGTFTTQYSTGPLHALARASYFGKFSSAQPGYCDLCRDRYGAKTLIDAEVGYRLGQIDLSIGARNLFDTYPDQPSSLVDVGGGSTAKEYNNNFGTFPWAAASPFGYNGRYLYARVEMHLPQ